MSIKKNKWKKRIITDKWKIIGEKEIETTENEKNGRRKNQGNEMTEKRRQKQNYENILLFFLHILLKIRF